MLPSSSLSSSSGADEFPAPAIVPPAISPPPPRPPLRVVVIGGGLGGLATTLSLLQQSSAPPPPLPAPPSASSDNLPQRSSCHVTCYERDQSFHDRRNGYGLTLTYNPRGPLADLRILEAVARKDTPSRSHYVFDKDGFVTGYFGNAFRGRPNTAKDEEGAAGEDAGGGYVTGQRGNMRIQRQVLRQILLEEINKQPGGADAVAWGKDFLSAELQSPSLPSSSSSALVLPSSSGVVVGGGGSVRGAPPVPSPKLTVRFKDGTVVTDVDVLVGADGVRSSVMAGVAAKHAEASKGVGDDDDRNDGEAKGRRRGDGESGLDEDKSQDASGSTPKAEGEYFGIMLILGISEFRHPLLHERGFYTLSGDARLFTMPFAGGALDDEESDSEDEKPSSSSSRKRLTMWQLSYNLPSLAAAQSLRRSGPANILSEALLVTRDWHAPVKDLIASSPMDSVWGSPLFDRSPIPLNGGQVGQVGARRGSLQPALFGGRLVCLGDAAHAMSPFKGQGANQALMDGPLLASWLLGNKCKDVCTAIKCFEREMCQRTGKKVKDSREAARIYHMGVGEEGGGEDGIAGVPKEDTKRLLLELRSRGVKAREGGDLDDEIMSVIRELGISPSSDKASKASIAPSASSFHSQLFSMSLSGDLSGIRSLSHTSSCDLSATDSDGRSLAHLAASGGHAALTKWLVKEAGVEWRAKDREGKTARDLVGGGEEDRRKILSFFAAREKEERRQEIKKAKRKDRERVEEKERERMLRKGEE